MKELKSGWKTLSSKMSDVLNLIDRAWNYGLSPKEALVDKDTFGSGFRNAEPSPATC